MITLVSDRVRPLPPSGLSTAARSRRLGTPAPLTSAPPANAATSAARTRSFRGVVMGWTLCREAIEEGIRHIEHALERRDRHPLVGLVVALGPIGEVRAR